MPAIQGLPSPGLSFAGGFFQKLSNIQDENDKNENKREDAAVARFEEGLKMYNQAKKQGADNAAKAASYTTMLGGDPNDPVVQNAAKMMANQGIDSIEYGQELVRQTKIKQAQAKATPGLPEPPAQPTNPAPQSSDGQAAQALPNAGPQQQPPAQGATPAPSTPPADPNSEGGGSDASSQTPNAIPTSAQTQGQGSSPGTNANKAQAAAIAPTAGASSTAGSSAAPPAMGAPASTPPIQSTNIKGPTQLPADQTFVQKYILGQVSPQQTAQNVNTRIQAEYGLPADQVTNIQQGNYAPQKLALDPSVQMASVNPEEVDNKQDILKKLVDIRNYSSPALFHKALGLIGEGDLEGAAGLADMTADKIQGNKVEIKNIVPPSTQAYQADRGAYYHMLEQKAEMQIKAQNNSVLSDNDIGYIKGLYTTGDPDWKTFFKGPQGPANQAKFLKDVETDPNTSPVDAAVANGNFKGYIAGVRTLENRYQPLQVGINELDKFSKQAKAIFSGGPDPYDSTKIYPGLDNGDSPDINALINFAEKHTGSPEQQRLGAALLGVSNAFAVVAGRGKLPTDSDKKAAREQLYIDSNTKGLPAVLDQYGMEGVMAKQSMLEARADYNKRVGDWSNPQQTNAIPVATPQNAPPGGLPMVNAANKPYVNQNGWLYDPDTHQAIRRAP